MSNLNALIHNSLIDVDVVEPLAEDDKLCFGEIRDVLKKYGKLDRFGLTLLHKHFEMDDDEILVESIDEETRTQIIQPFKKSVVDAQGGVLLETCWSLNETSSLMACKRSCVKQDNGHYSGVHVHTF